MSVPAKWPALSALLVGTFFNNVLLSVALVLHALNLFPYLVAGIVCLRLEARSRGVETAAVFSRRYAPTGAAGAGAPAGLQNQ